MSGIGESPVLDHLEYGSPGGRPEILGEEMEGQTANAKGEDEQPLQRLLER